MRIRFSVDSLLGNLTALGLLFCALTTAIGLQNFLPNLNPRFLVQTLPESPESTAYTPITNYQPTGPVTDPLMPSVGPEIQETPISTATTAPGYTSPASRQSSQTANPVGWNEPPNKVAVVTGTVTQTPGVMEASHSASAHHHIIWRSFGYWGSLCLSILRL